MINDGCDWLSAHETGKCPLTTLTLCPMALAGRLLLNLARTIPLLP